MTKKKTEIKGDEKYTIMSCSSCGYDGFSIEKVEVKGMKTTIDIVCNHCCERFGVEDFK
jgi:hypothetical protein